MSRSGYDDDYAETYPIDLYRQAVWRAIDGKRGQAFLREMLAAFDAMDVKRLIKNEFVETGEVCAIGAVAVKRGIDLSELDPEDWEIRHQLAPIFNIAPSMAAEVMYENDECGRRDETPEARFVRMRMWVSAQLSESDGGPR